MHRAPHSMSGSSISTRSCAGNRVLLRIFTEIAKSSTFPQNFLQYPIHLQHNHDTGMTEGAVHNYCNAVMWQYEGR